MKTLFISIFSLVFFVQLSSQVSFTLTPTICKTDTGLLTANTGTLTNCTFTWVCTPTANISAPNNFSTQVSFANANTYSITLTVMSGTITSSFQNSIAVAPLPVVTLSQNSFTTCITNNFPLYAKPVHLAATGGLTYTWNPPPSPGMIGGNPNGPANDVRPGATGCFSVAGTDANGCKAMAAACITVIPRFTINVTPTGTLICRNTLDGPGIYAELVAGNPSFPAFGLPASHSYSWTQISPGGILTPPFSPTANAAPQATSTYTVEMWDSLQCVSLPAMATVSVQNCNDIPQNFLGDKVLSVYPNPAKDKLTLEFAEKPAKTMQLSFLNTLGQIVYSSKELDTKQEIDLGGLPKGIYFLKLQNNSGQKLFKIIKE